MIHQPRITYLPADVVIDARVGDTLLDAALDNGVDIQHECGGNCACTTCHVMVNLQDEFSLLSSMEEVELDRLSTADGLAVNSRLACQAICMGGVIIVTVVESFD